MPDADANPGTTGLAQCNINVDCVLTQHNKHTAGVLSNGNFFSLTLFTVSFSFVTFLLAQSRVRKGREKSFTVEAQGHGAQP